MNKYGQFQAKDIDDSFFLQMLDFASNLPVGVRYDRPWDFRPHWVFIFDIERLLPMFPTRVILSKAKALIRRGLIKGCVCGCRGDFELTDKGKEFLRCIQLKNSMN